MDIKLSALLDIAATIIPALGSLAVEDKTGKLVSDIADVIKTVAKEDDAEKVKAKLESEPAVKVELEKRLAEIANQKAEVENQALEQKRRLDLKEMQNGLDAEEQKHQNELELIKKNLESTNTARTFAQKAALSERWWISGINPLLSIIITFAFLGSIFLIATKPLDGRDPSSKPGENNTAGTQTAGGGQKADKPPDGGKPVSKPEDKDAAAAQPAVASGDKNIIAKKTNNNRDVFLVAFGALATAFATVLGFHFGSSSGSKRKTQLQRMYGTRGTSTPATPQRGPLQQRPGSRLPGRKEEDASQASHPFEEFWLKNLSHIEHFNWEELLFKGASNARHKSNTDPDPILYPNVVPLVNLLEKIRKEIDAPIRLLSVYRSPAYNRDVGGASSSRHMQFDAADFHVLGSGVGTSDRWSKIAKKLRDEGEFKGGIGVYGSFVHVDTRGTNATWDNR